LDFDILQTTEKTLTSLHAEFSNIKAQERVYGSEWGSGDAIMSTFRWTWPGEEPGTASEGRGQ
jgi:hypothetical protein